MSWTDRLFAAIAAVCALALASALTENWMALGVLIWLLLSLELWLGFGRLADSALVRGAAAALFLIYTGVFAAMIVLHDPAGDPNLILGFPAGSALLVYGVLPLAILPTLFVTFLFDRLVLPPERVARLVERYGRRESD